jgi:hypothetical protein
VVAQHPVALRTEPLDRPLRRVIEPAGAELDRDAAQALEGVPEEQQLALGVGTGALRALRVPGVPDLQTAVARARPASCRRSTGASTTCSPASVTGSIQPVTGDWRAP